MKNSPALLILIAISFEIACYNFVKNPLFLVLISFIVISCACFIFRAKGKNTRIITLTILFLTILCSFRIAAVLSAPPPETAKVELPGVITMSSAFGRGHALIVQTGEGDYLVKRPKDENYNLGEALSLRGWIKPFPVIDDNSKFDEAKFWKSKGVRAELAVSSIERGTSGEANLHSIRQWIHDKIKSIPNTLRGYLDAMWTGLRDAELNEKHQRWGTSHLLAVSGFHVGLIAGLIESIFYFSRFRFRLRGIISSIFMWMYILISGAAPSAIRAAFMFQTGIIAGIIGRRVHAVNSVAVAATAMLLYSPFLFWNVGWRLSVIAALTITALTEIILDKKFKPWTWSIIPPAVTITTYPVVSSVFGSVPVVGVVLNLIAVPFFAFAFPFISIVAFIGVLQNVTDASLRLYGYIADFFTWILPWRVPYNTFLSMFCVLFFYGLMCSVLKNREELGVRSEELGVRSEE